MTTAVNLTKDIMKMQSPNEVTHAFGVQTSNPDIYKVYGYDTSMVPMVAIIHKGGKKWYTEFHKWN